MSVDVVENVDEQVNRLRVFVSYASEHKLDVEFLLNALRDLASDGWIDIWHDERLDAGRRFDDQIRQRIESADIILLLLSDAFLISDYCVLEELRCALRRSRDGAATIVPVLLRSLSTAEEARVSLAIARHVLEQTAAPTAGDLHRPKRADFEQRAIAFTDWPSRLAALKDVLALQRVPRGSPLQDWNNLHSAWANVAFHLRRVVVRRATSITLEGPRASWAALMRRRLSCEHRQAAWARRCVITGVAIAALWATIVGRLWPGSELAGFRGPALVACLIVAPLYGTAVIGSLLSSMLGCKEDVDRDSLWRVASVALLASGLLTCGIAALTASIIFAMGWSFHVGGTAFVIAACMAGVPAGRMFARLTRSGATYLPGDIDDEFTPEPLDDPPPIASAAPSRTITLPDVDSRGVMRAQFRLRTGVMRCVFVLALGLAAGFVGTILSAGLQRAHPGDTWTQAFLLAAPIALCVSFAGSAFWASIRLAPPARARELSLASLVNTNVRWLLTRTLKHAAWMLPVTCVGYFFGRSLFLEKPAFRLLPALTLGAIDVTPYLAWQTWKIWRAQRKSTQSRSSRER